MNSPRIVRRDQVTMSGFTLVELLVVIGIITVLISMLLPALNRARLSAIALQCSSNMRQAGIALTMYQDEYKRYLPLLYEEIPPGSGSFFIWQHKVGPYLSRLNKPYEIIHCPLIDLEIDGSSTLTYGLNAALIAFDFSMYKRTDKIGQTSRVILVADTIMRVPTAPHPYGGQSYMLVPRDGFPYTAYLQIGIAEYRHIRKANVLYLDGHVEATEQLPPNDNSGDGNQLPWQGKP